jgi:hypothetical protein
VLSAPTRLSILTGSPEYGRRHHAPGRRCPVEKAGNVPVRVEDPETHTAYLIVREDVYRRMHALTAIDHADRSLYEFGEFHPDR